MYSRHIPIHGWKGFIGGSAALVVMVLWYVLGFAGDHKPSFELYAVLSVLVTTLTIVTSYFICQNHKHIT